jgi:hypothetical protein
MFFCEEKKYVFVDLRKSAKELGDTNHNSTITEELQITKRYNVLKSQICKAPHLYKVYKSNEGFVICGTYLWTPLLDSA